MAGDGLSDYAPRSPDLSSFYSASPTQSAPQLQQPHGQAGYKLQPPAYSYGSLRAAASSLHAPYCACSAPPPLTAAPAPTSQPATKPEFCLHHLPNLAGGPRRNHSSRPPRELQHPILQAPAYGQPCPDHSQRPSYSPTGPAEPSSTANMPPRKPPPPPPPPAIEPSPVRTKFPTARIKRIMQADEEVGKVAQQTPIAVGKALELFMVQLVTKSAEVAKEKGSKRVTASMLKQVVETDEQWDFLRDIVSRVENEKEGSRVKSKAESESDEEMEEPKKRGRGGRRKKAA